MNSDKIIVVDIDGTLTVEKHEGMSYSEVPVSEPVKTRLLELKRNGFWIILSTSRNMRTYKGNIGQIIKHTAPLLLEWLARNEIPFDELHFGKPWCGNEGFYIDDRAVRPREFATLSLDEIAQLIDRDRSSE